ncbi:MAG: hypothetical protein IPI69_10220, partial [Bacteroidales bacterium]|nr:hypothetical protein [Bacteroidales bacterium]
TSESGAFSIDVRSSDGVIKFPAKSWKNLTGVSAGSRIRIEISASRKSSGKLEKFEPFHMNVSEEPADPYLAYRLIYPGYYNWSRIRIMQRSIEFQRRNSYTTIKYSTMNCINCHSFSQYNPRQVHCYVKGIKQRNLYFR